MDASIRKLRVSEDAPLQTNINPAPDFTHSDLYKYASLFNILRSFEEYTLNASGTIVSSNLEAVNITGYEEWEVIGKSFSIFYSPSEQAEGKPIQDLQKAREEGRVVIKGWRVKKRNVAFWAKVKIEYLKTSNHS